MDEILDQLAEGSTPADLAAKNPDLSKEAILNALRFAAEAVRASHPIDQRSPLELHGAHAVTLPSSNGNPGTPAVAVRAYVPEAAKVSVQRLPPFPTSRAWLPGIQGDERNPSAPPEEPARPMERIHPAGVFEALYPGETQPFPYRLTVTGPGGRGTASLDPYGLPPALTPQDVPRFDAEEAASAESAPTGADPTRQFGRMGAHVVRHAGVIGTAFAVWAPGASNVSVVGDFNGWDSLRHPMRPVGPSGVWELFIPGIGAGEKYKYRITARSDGSVRDKADPFAFAAEQRPATASIVWRQRRYPWRDREWVQGRRARQSPESPLSIYEVHLGSWRRKDGHWLGYRELADQLVPYVKDLGFTHIEPMPVMEHPLDGSWGYQVTGFFAPTSRYGNPDDFRYFVDRAHQAGIGVILDWVPGHFPKDEHGLARFDGTALYEHPDPRRSEQFEWGTSAFNLERPEVAAFLLSSARFWIEEFHIDGLRVDAVSSMLYLDYSRQHWIPNSQGGRENLDAANFLRRLNAMVHGDHPGVLMIAEESTAWPHVTGRDRPDSLGFDLKWNLGWMHDTLGYFGRDPVHRSHHHGQLTFSLVYAFSENFLLPFSHDEVVHGKRSLLGRMPGDDWQRFANLRALLALQYAHPGKKLLFMGGEFGATAEWNQDAELDWTLLKEPAHRRLRGFVRDLNRFYTSEPALHRLDFGWEGFEWVDCDDAERSVLAFVRRGGAGDPFVVVAANFTPVPREGYRLGVPAAGTYAEVFTSDDTAYGGSGIVNSGRRTADAMPAGKQPHSISITLPPLAVSIFRVEAGPAVEPGAALKPRALK